MEREGAKIAFNIATLQATLKADTTDLERGLKKGQDDLEKTAEKARSSGGIIQSALSSAFGGIASLATLGVGAAVAGLAGLGAAGVAAWGDYDAALDTVMQKTGLTGAALDEVGARVRALSGSTAGVGTDMAHIGEVMADLQVRTGTTGDALEGLASHLLQLQQVQGDGAVSAANFGRMLGDWSVPAAKGSDLMDQLFTASQKFGVSTDSLASKLVQFGSPLRQMGFDLQTSMAMFGQFERQGVNTELVLGSLRIAAGHFADAHVPLKQGLTDTIARIRDMQDSSAALSVAMDVFGARAGPDMAAAIREGRFALDDAVASLGTYQGSIQQAAEGAMDFPDQWAMGMNQVKAALVPVGQAVMDLGSAAMPVLQVGFNMAAGALSGFAAGLTSVAGQAGDVIDAVSEIAASFQSGGLGEGAASLVSTLGLGPDAAAQASAAMQGVQSAVQGGLAQVQSVAASAGSSLLGPLSSAFQTAGQIASVVLAGIPPLLNAVTGPISTIASLAGSTLSGAFQAAGSVIQSVLGVLPGLVQVGMSVLTSLAGTVSSVLAGAFQILAPIAQSVFAGIATVVQMSLSAVMGLASAVGSLLATAFTVLQQVALSVFNAIQPYVPALQAAIGQLAQWVGGVLIGAFDLAAALVRDVVIPGLTVLGNWLAQALPVAAQFLAGVWTNVLQPALAAVWGFIQGSLLPLFGQLVGWLQTAIPAALAALSGFWQQHGDQILSIAQTAWQTIQSVVDAVLGTISGLWTAWNQAREGDWRGFGETLRSLWDAAWQAIVSVVTTVGPQIVSALVQLATDAYAAFTAYDWGQLGRNIVEGIAQGVAAGASLIADAARGAAQAALDAAKGFLGIHSPSRVMAEQVGVPLAEGLAAGFAEGLDGSALVGVVAGVRRLMEQIGSVLKGVGDAVSMSDWEDLSGPVGQMANMVKSLADIGQSLASSEVGGAWAAARSQVRGLVESARGILADLAPLLKGVGDVASMSDWEDFTGPLTLMADSLASLTRITTLFADQPTPPDLGALRGVIRQLAVDARALLVDLDAAVGPVGPQLADKLKTLGDAAASARGVAENALALVRVLVEAMTVKWSEINFSAAGRMMADLGRMVVFFGERALGYAAALRDLDLGPLAQMKSAGESLLGIAQSARAVTLTLVEALGVDWGAVRWSDAGRLMADMGRMVVFFAERALGYAAALRGLDTGALAQLKSAAEAVQGAAAAWSLVQFALDTLHFDWSKVSLQGLRDGVTRLLLAGQAIAVAARDAMGAWSIEAVPALSGLGTVLQDSLSVVQTVFDVVERLLGGGLPGSAFAVPAGGGSSPIQRAVWRVVLAAQQIGQAAHDAMGTWQTTVPPGLATLKTVLSDSLGLFEDTYKAIDLVMGGANPAGFGAAFTPDASDTYRRSPIHRRVDELVSYARNLADMIVGAIGTWNTTVPPGLTTLKTVLSDSVGIFKDTYDAVGLVMGEGYGGINSAAFTPDASDTYHRSPIWQRISRLIGYATNIADMVRLAIGTWNMTVPPGLTTLKTVLSDSLGIFKDTFSIVDLVMGENAPDVSGPAFEAGETNPVAQRVGRLIGAARAIADAVDAALEEWDRPVKDGLTHLAAQMKASLEVATTTLDLNTLLGGETAPVLDTSLLKTRLALVITAGRELADEADRVIGDWDKTVKDGFTHLGQMLKASLETATHVLDLNVLLGGKTFPPFDVALLTTRLAQVVQAGREIADAADAAIADWDIEVKDSLTRLGDVLKSSLDVVGSVLDLSELQTRLLSFRGFDMGVWEPKLDLLITSAIAVAQEFGAKAANAGIQEAWQAAGAALKGLFGDAASTLKDALDMGTRLLDPEIQIPSTGQVQGKLDALFGLIVNVGQQYAAQASSLASQGADTQAAGALADQVKAIFESLSQVAQTVQDFTGIYTGSSGFNNIQALLDNVFGLFRNVAGQAEVANEVNAALSSLLGGLQALASESGYAAGASWASQFAAALRAHAGSVQAALSDALAPASGGGTTPPPAPGGSGGGGSVTHNTYHQERYMTVNLTQVASESTLTQSAGSLATLAALYGA